ncbi:TonB-dependent receptor [Granulicella arctica]|uniref:TonB-dependent transporter Oar-like beta-barrel domain-containing protein n=1 Tax=Granulicella arctica TaxID=940613 RepID=A0A7Y9TIS0_9BACT|nr:carboxypeptidase regulatory-like domain-containing protein [Granulicella arctica]NYF81325.1 hypothetical protein [Granulicella arctica]
MNYSVSRYAARTVFALLLALGSTFTVAQTNSATLTGAVVDQTRAVIPHAKIIITNEASGVNRSTIADDRGQFSIIGISVGTYDLTISVPGFKDLVRKGIAAHIGDQLELPDLMMAVSGGNSTVVVTVPSSEFTPTTSGEDSYTMSSDQIQKTNLEGRSGIELLGLVPGAANTGNFNGRYDSGQAGFTNNASSFSVNGTRFDQVQIVSDGASVTDLNTAGGASVTPNVDMIAELKVDTAAYSASQPNGPIVVSTETKSGGSNFHGMAQLNARHHIFDAVDWQEKTNGIPKPQTSLFYPAVQISGPVKIPGVPMLRDKLFFFAATELSQQHVQTQQSPVRKAVVPTAAMRTGDFSNAAYMSELTAASQAMVNPCISKPSWCNGSATLNPSMIDAGGQELLSLLPLPNADPTTHDGYNLVTDFVTSNPRNQEVLKIDYAPTEKIHAFVRYNHENESDPWPYGPYNTFNQTPSIAPMTGKQASNSINGNLTDVLSSSLTNELALSYTRFTTKYTIGNQSSILRSTYNFPYGLYFNTNNPFMPNVSFDNNMGVSYLTPGITPLYLGAQNTITISDGISKLKGNHLLRAGFYSQVAFFNNRTSGNDNGSYQEQSYNSASSGNDWADLLTGNIVTASQTTQNLMAQMMTKRFDFYAEDVWHVTSRLHLNYGLRVDHLEWWYDRGGNIAIFNPALYSGSTCGTSANVYTCGPQYVNYNLSGYESHKSNPSVPIYGSKPLGFQYAPSVGFAYDLDGSGRTVIRGGVGTNYYLDPGTNAYSGIEAPPNFLAYSISAEGNTLAAASTHTPSSDYSFTVSSYGSAAPKDHLAPVTYSWNLAVARELPWGNKLQVNFVGNSAHNLVGYSTANVVPEGCETGGGGNGFYGTFYQQQCRPYSDAGAVGIHYHNLNSNYNAGQLTLTRETGWLHYWGSFSHGKSLAYNAEDVWDMKRDYGPVPFDQTNALSLSYYISLPKFSGRFGGNKIAAGLLDGWHPSGIFQLSSGTPIGNNYNQEYAVNVNQITMTSVGPNFPNLSGEAIAGSSDSRAVPVMVCDPRKGLGKDQYFNANCFQSPTSVTFPSNTTGPSQNTVHNGTFRLPYIHGPAYENDSTGLHKVFAMRDSRSLEFGSEVFNIFNHPMNEFLIYYEDPNEQLDFNAYNAAPTNLSTAGHIDNKTGHRRFAFSVKYNF